MLPLIAAQTLSEKPCVKQEDGLVSGALLGSGSYGEVKTGCVKTPIPDCPFAIKTLLPPPAGEQGNDLVKDAGYLIALQDIQYLDPSSGEYRDLVPRIVETELCRDRLVMEKWDADMFSLAHKQAEEWKHKTKRTTAEGTEVRAVLTKAQLEAMMAIARVLDKLKITIPDLHLGQFLYRNRSPLPTLEIAVTDFGLASEAPNKKKGSHHESLRSLVRALSGRGLFYESTARFSSNAIKPLKDWLSKQEISFR